MCTRVSARAGFARADVNGVCTCTSSLPPMVVACTRVCSARARAMCRVLRRPDLIQVHCYQRCRVGLPDHGIHLHRGQALVSRQISGQRAVDRPKGGGISREGTTTGRRRHDHGQRGRCKKETSPADLAHQRLHRHPRPARLRGAHNPPRPPPPPPRGDACIRRACWRQPRQATRCNVALASGVMEREGSREARDQAEIYQR